MQQKQFETIEITDKGNLGVTLLYKTLPGRMCLRLLIRPTLSRLFGFIMDRRISALPVKRFVRKNKIDLNEYKDTKYKSFNAFFTREIKDGMRPMSGNPFDLNSPCDGALTAYPISDDSVFRIKGTVYDVAGLLKDVELAKEFNGGTCLIFRLAPDNYHRYCYIDDGKVLNNKKIKGVLHTVRPLALKKYLIYKQNAREYEVIETKNFGKAIQMEVGALFVGRIVNNKHEGLFKRGEEKGMFEFGGSTVVMLFKHNVMSINAEILENTRNDHETIVKMGMKIGEKTIDI